MINDNFHNNYKICSAQIKKLSLSSSLSVLVYLYPQFHKEGDQGQDQDHLHLLHGQVQAGGGHAGQHERRHRDYHGLKEDQEKYRNFLISHHHPAPSAKSFANEQRNFAASASAVAKMDLELKLG